jgi:NAD(P)-dependent dehydrogenase (short-subunit alcohol dehydrogenase family)
MSSEWQAMTQYVLYGQKEFTSKAFALHAKQRARAARYLPNAIDGKVVVLAGAVAQGVGFEIARFAACAGARLYLLTDEVGGARAAAKLRDICDLVRPQSRGNQRIFHVAVDLAVCADIARAARLCLRHAGDVVDVLVCCTLDEEPPSAQRETTCEGVEMVFAKHLLARYLLTTLLLPALRAAAQAGGRPRVVLVVSAELYFTKFPCVEAAASEGDERYDARRSFASAQRGQQLLIERLARDEPRVTFACANPGWVAAGASDVPLGLEQPVGSTDLRTAEMGADGACWLIVAPAAQVVSGRLYLDRREQPTHMAGAFFSPGWATKNSSSEVDDLVEGLRSRTVACTLRSASHEDVEIGEDEGADGRGTKRFPRLEMPTGEERGEIRAATLGRGYGGATGGVPAPRLFFRRYVEQLMCCV